MDTQSVYTGLDLKVRRVASRVKGRQLARELGVGATRVSAIEALAVVSPELADRYLTALDTCRTSSVAQHKATEAA